MAKAPLVSIVIPVYNAQDYLRASLSCASDQQYKKIEIIVIDDGSTDDSPEIIKEFADADPRIKTVRMENSGPSAARNIGIELAKGSYITFLDADDLCSDTFISRMISQIEPADVCVCKRVYWNQNKEKSTTDGWKFFYGTKDELRRILRPYHKSMRGCTGRLYKTSVIRENNIRFREDLRYGEDMHFNYEYFAHSDLVLFIDEVLYTYRIHNPNSLANQKHPSFLVLRQNQKKCRISAFGR